MPSVPTQIAVESLRSFIELFLSLVLVETFITKETNILLDELEGVIEADIPVISANVEELLLVNDVTSVFAV